MNRREALSTLVSFPVVSSIEVAGIRPHDVIVVNTDGYLSPEMVDRIRAYLAQVWPDNKALVLEKGMTLKVVREGA